MKTYIVLDENGDVVFEPLLGVPAVFFEQEEAVAFAKETLEKYARKHKDKDLYLILTVHEATPLVKVDLSQRVSVDTDIITRGMQ